MLTNDYKIATIKKYYFSLAEKHVILLKYGTARERLNIVNGCSKFAPWVINPLINILNSDTHEVVFYSKLALIKLGECTIPYLIDALQKDVRVKVRSNVIRVLGSIGNSQATHPLISALNNEEATIRQSAAYSLMMIKDDASAQALCQALQDTDVLVRRCAVSALAYIADWSVRPALIHALQDVDNEVKTNALYALECLEEERKKRLFIDKTKFLHQRRRSQSEYMRTLLQNRDKFCRTDYELTSEGGNLCGRAYNRPNSWAREHSALLDKKWQFIPTVSGSNSAMNDYKNYGLDQMEENYKHPWADRVEMLIEKLVGRRSYDCLLAEALGEIRDPRAKEPLLNLLECNDETLRGTVEDALRNLGVSDAIILKRIEKYDSLSVLNDTCNMQDLLKRDKARRLTPTGYAIPTPPKPEPQVFTLNMESVQQKIEETVQVHQLLAVHFTEEELPPFAVVSASIPMTPQTQSASPFKSLTTPYFVFLNMLMQKPV